MLLQAWSAALVLSYLSVTVATPIDIDDGPVSLIALEEVEALWNKRTLWSRQDTGEVLDYEPGTQFDNNPIPPPGNTGLGLTGTDAEPQPVTSVRTSFGSQPNLRSKCGQYEMVPQYSAKYRNIPLCSGDGDACVEMEHIVQGETGDCGFGSAMIALIANGQSGLVHDALEWKGNRKLVATFKTRSTVRKGQFIWKTLVNIDDKLPVFIDKSWKTITTPQKGCAKNRGYQFCAIRGDGCSRRLQVPFLEKAWAKFIDFRGDSYRSDHAKGKFGYEGLDGTDSARVLEAFTGNKAQRVYRNAKQYPSKAMKDTILSCLSTKVACTLGSLNRAKELKDGSFDYHITDTGKPIKNQEFKRALSGGSTVEPVIGSGMYTVYDAKLGKTFTLARGHAYALLNDMSTDDGFIYIRNPWGCAGQLGNKGCDENGYGDKGTIYMSLDVAAYAMHPNMIVMGGTDCPRMQIDHKGFRRG